MTNRIGFAYNPTNEAALELRERAGGWCEVHGIAEWASPASDLSTLVRELPGTDALVVLGGDGTFLRAAQAVAEVDVPILGVNLGKVGFLSRVEAESLETMLGHLANGAFGIDERMAVCGRILPGGMDDGGALDESALIDASREGDATATSAGPRDGAPDDAGHRDTRSRPFVALNDVVVARGSLARVCRLDVSIDGSHLATFVADGLVVASPTGSTGYSFSAGGPILDPVGRSMVVTPIAAYLSAIRSVVVSPDQTVRCRVLDAYEALVSIDGREDLPLAVGDVVEVRAYDRPIRFIEPPDALPFWDLLRHKVELLPS